VESLIKDRRLRPGATGRLAASVRIEVSGDLHAAGGLNGRLLHKEAASLLITPKQGVCPDGE